MKNSIRVGVKEWSTDRRADDEHEANASVQVHWVEVDGVRIPGVPVSVDWFGTNDVHTVKIELVCSKFETVDASEGPPVKYDPDRLDQLQESDGWVLDGVGIPHPV